MFSELPRRENCSNDKIFSDLNVLKVRNDQLPIAAKITCVAILGAPL